MKPVKNFVFATIVVLSLALNTLGGEIDVPGAPAPPPRITAATDDTTEVTNTGTQETTAETADYLFLEALAALLSVY
jgi:hypothetical protein